MTVHHLQQIQQGWFDPRTFLIVIHSKRKSLRRFRFIIFEITIFFPYLVFASLISTLVSSVLLRIIIGMIIIAMRIISYSFWHSKLGIQNFKAVGTEQLTHSTLQLKKALPTGFRYKESECLQFLLNKAEGRSKAVRISSGETE